MARVYIVILLMVLLLGIATLAGKNDGLGIVETQVGDLAPSVTDQPEKVAKAKVAGGYRM